MDLIKLLASMRENESVTFMVVDGKLHATVEGFTSKNSQVGRSFRVPTDGEPELVAASTVDMVDGVLKAIRGRK